MKKVNQKVEEMMALLESYIEQCPQEKLNTKASKHQWSKKEILGHLIDSAINNLQRFTEIQYEPKPYFIRKYRQDELVKVNHYQKADVFVLLELWKALNKQIIDIIAFIPVEDLSYEISFGTEQNASLGFLINDYVDHMKHHVQQILT